MCVCVLTHILISEEITEDFQVENSSLTSCYLLRISEARAELIFCSNKWKFVVSKLENTVHGT